MKLPVASHTMLQAFDNCPHKGYRMYIAKDLPKFAPDDKQQVGIDLHKAMLKHLSTGKVLPDHFREYGPLAAPMFQYNPQVEMPLAIDQDGKPCGFFDDRVYVRGYADVAAMRGNAAVIFDWKTGKKREDPAELKLHALMLQAKHPAVTAIYGHYIWLQDKAVGKQHDLSDTHVTWSKLNEQMDEIAFMAGNGAFPKTPNPLCGWCNVMDCEHNSVKQRLAREAANG
jgi:ATP-dependent exoDNAse (exonuclease V) beta subunit